MTSKKIDVRQKIEVSIDVIFFGYNFTQNLRNIEFYQAKRLSYLLELFSWHILAKFKENRRNGFSAKAQKMKKRSKKMPLFRTNERFSIKRAKNKKNGRATFLIFFTPKFMQSFGKILGAVPEIICDTRTHTHTRT